MRSDTFSTWALSVMDLAVFWLLAGSLTAETVRLYPFVLLFFLSAVLFLRRPVCAVWRYGGRRMGAAARQGAAWPVCVVRACRPGAVSSVRRARHGRACRTGRTACFRPWRRALRRRASVALPSTFLAEFLFILLRRTFPGRWFLLFACGLVSLGVSMAYGLPGQVAYGADGALRYLVYYALGAGTAAFVRQKRGRRAPRAACGCARWGVGGLALALLAFCFWFGTGWATSRLGGRFLLVQAATFAFALAGITSMALAAFVLEHLRIGEALGACFGSCAWPWRRGGAVWTRPRRPLGMPRNLEKPACDAGAFCGHLRTVCGAVAFVPQKLPVVFGAGE